VPPSDKVRTAFVELLRRHREAPLACGVWTLECVLDYLRNNNSAHTPMAGSRGQRDPLLSKFKQAQLPQEWESQGVFPSLKAGSLGTCAVVAVGDNLLQPPGRGAEIDAHDTVWRYNSPIKKWGAQVGRRSDILYWKVRKDEKDYGVEGQRASRFVMFKDEGKFFLFGSPREWEANTFRGMPVIWATPLGGTFIGQVYKQYREERNLYIGSASGGCKFAMDVLASRLCTRVDLYGYTAGGSSKYFNPAGKSMNLVHLIGLEHWMYRVAMEEGMMCVYD